MKKTVPILLALSALALAGCGVKPGFPLAPEGSPAPRTYPDPALDPPGSTVPSPATDPNRPATPAGPGTLPQGTLSGVPVPPIPGTR